MRKYYIIILTLILLASSDLITGTGSDSQTINITKLVQAGVSLPGQKQEIVVPADPLDFDSTLEWEVIIAKKGLATEKDAAYFLVEELGTVGKQLERKTISASGRLAIPKGARFKITIYAGEYSRLVTREGASVKVKLQYAEAQVRYSQGDKPYLFNLEVAGPAGLDNWSWLWGSNDATSGKRISHQFNNDGKIPVIVEGKGKTLSGLEAQKFYFELEVPPLVILDPKVEPLKGPVELNVTAKVNAVVNYGQKASYSWNFGNGVELSGPEVGNNYTKPGNYYLVLSAKVAGVNIQKSWLVEAQPLTINPNPVVTPLSGPVPLEVTGTVNPSITGGPTQLIFSWEIGKEVVAGGEIKHKFTEPGEYQLILKTADKLHPAQMIPESVFLVKALPPQLTLKPTASISKGNIPLAVNFEPNLKIEGSPVDPVFNWDFGDGETAGIDKPNHVFKKPGVYDVQVVLNDRLHQGNLAYATLKIEVLPPEMKVTAIPNVSSGLAPLKVSFNAQIGVTGSPCDPQYCWDFGDGGTSVEQNPVHVFKQEGNYKVTLEVKDWLHPANSVKTSVEIEVKLPKLRLTANVTPVSGKAPLIINCQAWADKEGGNEASKLKYTWDFGDGVTAEGMDQKHTFENPGTYNVLIFVEDQTLGITERKTFKVVVK